MRSFRPRRVLIVANPAAGRKRRGDAAEAVAREARRLGVPSELMRTREPGDATRIAAGAPGAGFDLVLAVGGDGTAHEVAQSLAGTGVAMGVAAAGTMNLLARVLGLPLRPERAAELVLRTGRRLAMRPGIANGRLFLLMAGVGLDAWVLRDLLGRVRGKVSMRHYVAGALHGLGAYEFPDIRFEISGGGVFRATSGIVGRAPLYGGFLRPTPRASLDRDVLEICGIQGRSWIDLLRLVPELWSGAHLEGGRASCRIVTGLRAESENPDVPLQLDGEPCGVLPAEFGLSERSLVLAA